MALIPECNKPENKMDDSSRTRCKQELIIIKSSAKIPDQQYHEYATMTNTAPEFIKKGQANRRIKSGLIRPNQPWEDSGNQVHIHILVTIRNPKDRN